MSTVFQGTGEAHPFLIPLTKVDVEKRLVIGTAAAESLDKSGEIMDYISAKPAFEKWSSEASTRTGGLSKGNLRVMHTKHVAGRFDQIAYDDMTKTVQVVAHVVDENDWQKCLAGCYTGFSIGGGYAKRWTDADGNKRYTPRISEISLVDNPCIEKATFAELVKADGVVEQLVLHGRPATFADVWAARPLSFAELRKRAVPPPSFLDLYRGA